MEGFLLNQASLSKAWLDGLLNIAHSLFFWAQTHDIALNRQTL